MPFHVATGKMGKGVDVDTSNCEGGSGCFQELRWDTVDKSIVAVAIGFGKASGTVHSQCTCSLPL